MMKRLAMLIAVVAMIWSGYWLAGWWGLSKGIDAWFDARRAEGWVAEYDDITILGFPNRFDSTFTTLTLADPDTAVAWEMPFFQLFALSYRPNHLIAVWPPLQTLATPAEKLTLQSGDLRASAVLRPGAALALDRTNLAAQDLLLSSTADWQMAARRFDLAMRAQPDTPATYRLAIRAEAFSPPAINRLPAELDLPRAFDTFDADLTASFDREWDRSAIEDRRPQPTALTLTKAAFVWGDLELHAAGDVTIDAQGLPTGKVTIRAVNWREILAVTRATGRIAPGLLDTVESALDLLSQLAGNANQLDIPLTFKNGATRLGPVPIGPAPRIVLR